MVTSKGEMPVVMGVDMRFTVVLMADSHGLSTHSLQKNRGLLILGMQKKRKLQLMMMITSMQCGWGLITCPTTHTLEMKEKLGVMQ